jgi:hypothetical protein
VGEEEEGAGKPGISRLPRGGDAMIGGMARMGEGEATALGSPPPPPVALGATRGRVGA